MCSLFFLRLSLLLCVSGTEALSAAGSLPGSSLNTEESQEGGAASLAATYYQPTFSLPHLIVTVYFYHTHNVSISACARQKLANV